MDLVALLLACLACLAGLMARRARGHAGRMAIGGHFGAAGVVRGERWPVGRAAGPEPERGQGDPDGTNGRDGTRMPAAMPITSAGRGAQVIGIAAGRPGGRQPVHMPAQEHGLTRERTGGRTGTRPHHKGATAA